MTISASLANRLGFSILGLTNNFAYVIMLSAAYDLLAPEKTTENNNSSTNGTSNDNNNSTLQTPYCNPHSTSTILLADTLPSLATKLVYPFLLVNIPTGYKALGTALLSALAFIVTGLTANKVLIFTGVICASFSSGLGESTFLSNTPLYGDVSLSGWSMGTGMAGLLGAASYALLTLLLPIKYIMLVMLVVPIVMLLSFFRLIVPINDENANFTSSAKVSQGNEDNSSETAMRESIESPRLGHYGGANEIDNVFPSVQPLVEPPLDSFKAKLYYLPTLAKYFLPLLFVYFGEYFINQGLFELVYYPEIAYLSHAAQYRWFQVSYQLGVFISRSSLDLLQIRNLWAMALLQLLNAVIFLAHASKLFHIPSFYLVIGLIIYEGLLGGFTYVNTFYRVKKEVSSDKQEFCISAVTTADSLGIVFAGLVALPVHDALCKLY